MHPPEGGPPTVPLPDPIVTSSTTFDLGADPAALERAAEAVRTTGGQASTARTLVDAAAGRIEVDNAWEGDTADSFQTHRRRLTADLGVVGDAAARAAGALADIAGVLRAGQAMLDDQRDRLAGVAVTVAPVRSPEPGEPAVSTLTFEPRDPAEHALVSSAIAAAQEIRGDVDEQLATQAGRLRGVRYGWSQYDPTHSGPPSLRTVSDQWKPRDVRVLTYNVGQGYQNEPWFMPGSEGGTDAGDIPDAGRVIAGSGANVVALQEMFREDAERLMAWLNANAGGGWEMHFERATTKYQWDANTNPFGPDSEVRDFGNVVLVRGGGDVGDPTQQPAVRIQDSWVFGEEERVLQNTEVPLEQ
ncbi:hypothetical protein QLQ12_45505 [Actinoplanes sp. NEAU-A12]|uniref:Endonuclease/exonuclease/phosphatase n=1 Tax=Actinoplanes sandaracinus TaxID=3045177 RepID=A0ABT6X1G6_9ACTN|nr:hypothetical protein [Actinoplanes sandaracinus]MDI6105852.1 hypothetical protein [Actinoplanes sandaracinus]